MSEHNEAASNATTPDAGKSGFRPESVAAVPLATIAEALGVGVPEASESKGVTGISLNSRTIEPEIFIWPCPAPPAMVPTLCRRRSRQVLWPL